VDSWTHLNRLHEGHYRVFDVFRQRMKSPRTGNDHEFFVIDAPDWVNVIPLTADDHVVCVRQYRPGTDQVTLEIPGGMIDPEDADPVAAAAREMREETGYTATRFDDIGCIAPNPAIQSNRCYTVCACDAVRDGPQALDGAEEIDVELVPLDTIPSLVAQGRITHSLVIAAFYLLDHRLSRPARR